MLIDRPSGRTMTNMTVVLRPMTESEYEAFRTRTARAYANHKVASGEWLAEGAEQRALADQSERLPDGAGSTGALLLRAEDEEGLVGWLWLGPRWNPDGQPGAPGRGWISMIEVDDARRGHGLGRALLAAAEQAAREAGYTSIGLNVFGANTVARTLYETSGYVVDAQQMSKPL
jgi:ribosomal protein S18 acetylase RimI-like enzyme